MTREAVDWGSMKHAYGKATDVPDMLRDLGDPAPEVRSKARSDLEGALAHQGTRFAPSALAVPFVIAALDGPHADRAALLDLLSALADGDDAAWWLTGHPPGRKGNAIGGHARKAYAAVALGLPRYLSALEDDDPGVRASAAHLLAWLGTEAKKTRPPIVARVEKESDEGALASALLALAYVGGDEDVALVAKHLGDARAPVREAAAVALLHLGSVELPVLSVVEDLLRRAPRKLHWWDRRPHELNQAVFGWEVPGAAERASAWGALSSIAAAHVPRLAETHPKVALAMWIALREGSSFEGEAAGMYAIEAVAHPDADPAMRDRFLGVYATREDIWTKNPGKRLAEHGFPDRPWTLRAALGLPPRAVDRPRTLLGKEATAREALARAVEDGSVPALVEDLAGRPVAEAWAIALAWSGAADRPETLLEDLAARLATLEGIEEVIEIDALSWRRAGELPAEVVSEGWQTICTPMAALAVEVGIALAARGSVPRPWLEATCGFLVEYKDLARVVRALMTLPIARRVALVRWALIREGSEVLLALAPLAPVPEVIEPVVQRFRSWGQGSGMAAYEAGLAAFGAPAIPFLEAVAADGSVPPKIRKVFAALVKRVRG